MLFGVVLILLPCCWLGADEPDSEGIEFFESKIRPVLVEHCYECHAEDSKKIRAGLLLDTREGTQQGGDSGPAVTPGKLDESLLLEAIRYETFEMPPEGPLPDEVVADFEHWISIGAPDPRDGPAKQIEEEIDIEAGRKFWSFQPLRKAAVPEVKNKEWPRSEIDRYLLARLESEGLDPVKDADRVTLLRRAYYALIGLPPSVEEIEAFKNDPAPFYESFTTVVDRLLASEHFGERWGRHWLDVARFAESSGGGRSLLFPDAWRYRDYVIEAFNHDVPYDEFVKQQIAGDLLDEDDWQQRRRNITATAFLVLGPNNYELQDKEVLEMDIVDEQLITIGKSLLGMTLGCARCHDHKFDPIPTRDYYALAGILKSTKSVIHSNVSAWNMTPLPLPPEKSQAFDEIQNQIEQHQKKLSQIKSAYQESGGDLDLLKRVKSLDVDMLPGIVIDDTEAKKHGEWTGSTSVPGYVGASYVHVNEGEASIVYQPKLPGAGRYEIRITYTPHPNRSSKVPVKIYHENVETIVEVNQKQPGSIQETVHSLGFFNLNPENQPSVTISTEGATKGAVIADAVMFIRSNGESISETEKAQQALRRQLRAEYRSIEGEIEKLQAEIAKLPSTMAVVDLEDTSDIPLAIRGVVHNAGPIVPRGVLQVALVDGELSIPEHTSGRMQLAEWIANPKNPLTARVMVNRVWHWLFGYGLVRTVDNFGSTGEEPSHPELLDYLAQEFIEDGWSVKRLIRRLMLSHVYQLSSVNIQAAEEVDPENRMYWRMNRQPLDAESLRDTLLLLGGNLDLSAGGSNIKMGTKSEYGYKFDSLRRSVYEPVFRNSLSSVFETFDFADPNIQVGRRTRSTTATQALLLMNHPLVMKQAIFAAEKMLATGERNREQKVEHVYLQVLGRLPTEREEELAVQYVGTGEDAKQWGVLYHTLFQSLDFRYLD